MNPSCRWVTTFLPVLLVTLVGCSVADLTGVPSGPLFDEFAPTRITASWIGGAKGAPNDRRDEEAIRWNGLICPASSTVLDNHSANPGHLTIFNTCTQAVTYFLCATKGIAQPPDGLPVCADDPLQTPFSRLESLTLTAAVPGGQNFGFPFASTQNFSVNVFFCSDVMQLKAAPIVCFGAR